MKEKLEVPSLAAWKVAKVKGVSAPRSKPSVEDPQLWSKSTWEMEVDTGGAELESLLLEVDDAVKKGKLTAADKVGEKALKDALKREKLPKLLDDPLKKKP